MLPIGTMLRGCDLHSRNFVLGTIRRPVTVFCRHYVGSRFRIVECGVYDAWLNSFSDLCYESDLALA